MITLLIDELTFLKPRTICFVFLTVFVCGLVMDTYGQWNGLPHPVHITSDRGLPQAFIPAMLQDQKGFVWMATLDGLCRYDGRDFKVFRPSEGKEPSLSSAAIIGLKQDREGGIWILTERGTIDYFNPADETFENISRSAAFQKAIPWKPYQVMQDSRNLLWIGFKGQGLASFNSKTQEVRRISHDPEQDNTLSHDQVNAILEDRQGYIWAGTPAGLDRLDPVSGDIRHYRHEKGNVSSLPENNILGVYQRKDGSMLIVSENYVSHFHPGKGILKSFRLPGSRGQSGDVIPFATDLEGNDYFVLYGNLYRFHPQPGVQLLSDPGVGALSVYVDRTNVLWVGTNGQGMYKFNLRAGCFQAWSYEHNFITDLLSGPMGIDAAQLPEFHPKTSPYYFRSTLDKKGRVWFNTGFTPFFRWDPKSRQLDQIPFLFPLQSYEPAPPVPMATDPDGKIWVLYDKMAAWYDDSTHTWKQFPFVFDLAAFTGDQTGYMRLLQFVVDDQDLWVITNTHGLFQINRKTGHIIRHTNDPKNASSISSDALFSIFDDPDDENLLWIGTFGNGLCRFDKRTGKTRRFTEDNGLPNNVVYAAIPSANGYLWIATNKGLCKLNRNTFDTQTFTKADGLQANEFNRFHFIHFADDRIVLGGIEGMTAFYPDKITDDTFEPGTEIIAVWINNRFLQPGRDSLAGALPLHQINHLELGPDQNFVTVGFVGLQFNNSGKMQYRYLLEGVNQDWVVSDRPEAIYTNLRPGFYTLKLNSSNSSGKWSPHVRILTFRIVPPWWASWWAWSAYVLIILGIAYSAIRLYLKQKEAVQLKKIDAIKTRFFTNITHEFRTPLTLILSPVHQLKKAMNTPPEWQKNEFRLNLIERNAHQLLKLVNQLLDLDKLETRTMETHNQLGDISVFVEELVNSFQDQAADKSISLQYDSELAETQYWFDGTKLESIVYNLVANAIKFTENGGRVVVTIAGAHNGINLIVADTGQGIEGGMLPRIFDRFFQIDDSATRAHEGSGIGLALVKELVDFMEGQIRVKSQPGKGTEFKVYLPFEVMSGGDAVTSLQNEDASEKTEINLKPGQERIAASVILLVEDNRSLSDFVADCLPDHYRVERAFNGKEGFDKAVNLMPDMIISDVLMPVMDGYTLCHQLKTDIRTSHIPVMLLTARTSQGSRLKGLSLGADHYLSKPFHPDELRLEVMNLIEQQLRYRNWLQARIVALPAPFSQISDEIPDLFIQKVYTLVEANLDNAHYDVNELTMELGMHRATLFRKIKVLTNLSPTELVRGYRIKRAAQLLSNGAMVSEVAYKVGFDNLSYFSKCFRTQFGLSPSEYSRRNI